MFVGLTRRSLQCSIRCVHSGAHKRAVRNPFTHEEVQMLKSSFASVKSVDSFSEYYFDHLLKRDPKIIEVIGEDKATHVHRISKLISDAVDSSHKITDVFPDLLQLGKEHRYLGANEGHYKVFGAALFDTLHHFLGEKFDPHTQELWRRIYGVISSMMLSAK